MSSTATVQQNMQISEQASSTLAEAQPRVERLFRWVCVVFTLTLPALVCLGIAYVAEPDMWWHLTSGDWILSHHALPRVDMFSSTTMGNSYVAYSWLFEVLLAKLYAHFGLAGVVGYSTAMVLAIVAALFQLIYASQKSLRIALPLTTVAAFAMLTLFSPRPWHFTILFFIVELAIVWKARRSGNMRPLLVLPVVFALWANVHIQFIDGLLLLVLLLVESLLFHSQQAKSASISRVSPAAAAALLVGCVCATLVNPYGWHIYSVAHDLASQTGVVNGIEELKAMPFRAASNYFVLFLTLAATAVLARKGRFQFFETVLLISAATLSFRSQRDIWIAVAVSAAVLAEGMAARETPEHGPLSGKALALATGGAALCLLGMAQLVHLTDARLQPKLASSMPVEAAAFVREHHFTGPVFCDFVWGGYLMHALAIPVSMDGRAALHGDAQLDLSAHAWAGAPEWAANPQLGSAGVVVGPKSAALTQLLKQDTRFDSVYEDKLAVVFIPHKQRVSPSPELH